MRLIKRTHSVDSETGRRVPARIVEEDGQVFMLRQGKRHLIERDAELYELLTTRGDEQKRIQHLVVEPTYACNLSCPFCFTKGQKDDFALDEMKEALKAYKNRVVSISGGEPTLKEDLPKIIRAVNERNIPLLATNGLKLRDKGYVRHLKAAGLRYVTFSLNGFTEKSLIGTNGASHLAAKLEALKNMEEAGIHCLLSMLLKKGLNEGEIPALLEYAHQHPQLVREIRIRSTASVGKYAKHTPRFISEILTLFCEQAGIRKETVMRELQFRNYLSRQAGAFWYPFRSCSLSFHLIHTRVGYRPLGESISLHTGKKVIFYNLYALTRMLSPLDSLLEMAGRKRRGVWKHHPSVLKIVLRSWPRPDAIDLLDHSVNCGTRYIIGKKAGQSVCYANLMSDVEGKAGNRHVNLHNKHTISSAHGRSPCYRTYTYGNLQKPSNKKDALMMHSQGCWL